MDSLTIIYIFAAFAIGCAIAWVISRQVGKSSNAIGDNQETQNLVEALEEKVSSLKEENAQLQSAFQEKEKVAADKIKIAEEDIKARYEQLVKEIQEENARLDSALKSASEGKIDESVNIRLLQAEQIASKISEMEAEHSALKKKIKQLEDDIDEAEEEQMSLEKKLKSKSNELLELSEELDKSSRENKKLCEELEQKENELSNRIDELKRKSGSIEFVQAILSAQEIGTKDVKDLHRAIDIFEAFVKGQLMDCNFLLFNKFSKMKFNNLNSKAGYEAKKKWYLQAFDEWASVKRKSWLDKKTTIAFVGEFSAGKTSIVNRILSQDNPGIPLLPVSTKATTAIPTYISGDSIISEPQYLFVTPDNKQKDLKEENFKKVSKEVLDEVKGISSLIKYFVMKYKNPNLSGLSILDTPGFNSNDAEDKARTIDIINECDALFWVVDVNAGTVNESSRSLIKEKLNKPLIVIINKVDTKPQSEVDNVEALIRKTLTDEGLNVDKLIRFSAKSPIEDIMTPIHSIKHDSVKDNFISTVEDNICQLIDYVTKMVKSADREYQNCLSKSNSITDKFIDKTNQLIVSCEEARNIPNFVKGTKIFGMELTEDRYEMSTRAANSLKSRLDNISGSLCQELAGLYYEHTESVTEAQQTYSNLIEVKACWQKIDDCLKEFKKTTKQFR